MIQEICSGFSSVSFSNLKKRKKKNGHGVTFFPVFRFGKLVFFRGFFRDTFFFFEMCLVEVTVELVQKGLGKNRRWKSRFSQGLLVVILYFVVLSGCVNF